MDMGEGTIEDPELLMRVMEAREEVEGTADKNELAALRAKYQREYDRVVADLAQAFGKGELPRAASLEMELRYVSKILEQIVERL